MASQAEDNSSANQNSSSKRVRATNFNVNEILKIEELVKANLVVLQSKLSNQVTNNRKNEIWKEISRQVSSLGYAYRSDQACSEKWANIKRKSKADVTTEKLERRKTGGGTVVGSSEQSKRVADMMADTSAFSGILGGGDSDELDGLHYLSNTCVNDVHGNVDCEGEKSSLDEPVTTAPTTSSSLINDVHMNVMPGTSNTEGSKASVVVSSSKRPPQNRLALRKQAKRSKTEILTDYQIAYFKGMVERQDLEKEVLQVKLRTMKAAECKLSELNAAELLNVLIEQ